MADQIENYGFDEDEAVRFIQSHIPQEIQGKYQDDDIVLITDIEAEYFQRNGWLDSEEEIEIDMDDIVDYIVAQCKKDKDCTFDIDPEAIYWIVEAELDYEESLG